MEKRSYVTEKRRKSIEQVRISSYACGFLHQSIKDETNATHVNWLPGSIYRKESA